MNRVTTFATALAVGFAAAAQAAIVPLASTMDLDSFVSEDAVTGSFAQISQGDGSLGPQSAPFLNSTDPGGGDADGLYDIGDLGSSNPTMFGDIDLFPRENAFEWGTLTYDDTGFTGVGVEVFPVTGLDLSGFWTEDPNRTNGSPGSPPLVISDVSDRALGLWFFDADGEITFGGVDAADTVTFTNGFLTSIDVETTTSFILDDAGTPLSYDGTFSISGSDISYQVQDTNTVFGFFASTWTLDLTGRVNAVVPEPSSAAIAALALIPACLRRRLAC